MIDVDIASGFESLRLEDGDVIVFRPPVFPKNRSDYMAIAEQLACMVEKSGKDVTVLIVKPGASIQKLSESAMAERGWVRNIDRDELAVAIAYRALKTVDESFGRGYPTFEDRKEVRKALDRLAAISGLSE